MRPLTHIVVHHSLSADGPLPNVGAVREFHKSQGWREVGYHYLVELLGKHYEIVVGRPLAMPGAHCTHGRMNERSIGICLIGDFDKAPPPPAQWDRAVYFVADQCEAYNIPADHVIGHREAGAMDGFDWRAGEFKSCPGKFFDTGVFRAAVGAALRARGRG